MEEKIEQEIKRFIVLKRLEALDGVSGKEREKLLRRISDKTILEVARRGIVPRDKMEEVLVQKMQSWDFQQLIKAIKEKDNRLSSIVYFALVRKIVFEGTGFFEKASSRTTTKLITKAIKEAEEKRRKINELREWLELDPICSSSASA